MFLHEQLPTNDRFRERRRRALHRRRLRRLLTAAVLAALAAGLALGTTFIRRGHHAATAVATTVHRPVVTPAGRAPAQIRGVHVTMDLASLQGRLEEYLGLKSYGLNTVELDVKDEQGHVGFVSTALPVLARSDGAARPFYDAAQAVAEAHSQGLYLIGRVVVFEDPLLARARPELAIHDPHGALWRSSSGLPWTSPYDRRVWSYNVSVAEAAARAGFDEILFDYVRFPSDGSLARAVYPAHVAAGKDATITGFLTYAVKRLRPLGVKVSASLFGLAAHEDLGIGQSPAQLARVLDGVYPMLYPSGYGRGQYGIDDPDSHPGMIVARSLADFRRAVAGTHARLVPWLQDFSGRTQYTLLEVADQIAAAHRGHAAGFLLWNAQGRYTEDALDK